ncbi:ABC transporter permease [Microbacterium sp.]|uniref:ABC transporter permease n=1 Tax=Microbacterium sp. TaxID=51671 RepID=UPI0039E6B77E
MTALQSVTGVRAARVRRTHRGVGGGVAPRITSHGAARAGRSAGAILAQAAVVLLLASFLTFALGAASGSDPAAVALGDMATPEDVARLNAEFGLDRPFLERYVAWLAQALTGDLGRSWFTGIPVSQSIGAALPVSLSIAAGATLVALLLGGVTGVVAAVRRGTWIDRAVTAGNAALATIPAFVAGIVLILLFAYAIPLFPVGGYVPPQVSVAAWLGCLVLPALALSLDAAADLSRQLRTSLVGALDENYIIGARVHGLGGARIVWGHALPNALGPALATLGVHVPRLVGGAVITEAVFGMPGLGRLARTSAVQGDVPVVQGVLLVSAAIVVVSGIVVNLVLARVSPTERSAA